MSLAEIDLANPDNFVADTPHHWFRELRREAPVWWNAADGENEPGFWVISKYDDLKSISRQPNLFSSHRGATTMNNLPQDALERVRLIMLNMDPPQHVKFRRLVQRGFTPRMIEDQKPHIKAMCKQIVDKVAHKGECEFVQEVACELPLQVICQMMGVPQEDRHRIFELTNNLIGFDDPEYASTPEVGEQSSAEIFGYGMKLAQLYKDDPDANNLTAKLIHAQVDGERLNELEFCSFFMLLLVAGNETTRTVTVHGMRQLIEHLDQLQELVDDPKLIPGAVEEILRHDPAVHYFRRTATKDTQIRGQKIAEGEKVTLWYPSANHDEDVFEDPDRFDIHRSPNDHLSFGIGEHFCLGASLARAELYGIFEELVPRLRDPQHTAPVRRLRSNFINGVKEMRISFTPEGA